MTKTDKKDIKWTSSMVDKKTSDEIKELIKKGILVVNKDK